MPKLPEIKSKRVIIFVSILSSRLGYKNKYVVVVAIPIVL